MPKLPKELEKQPPAQVEGPAVRLAFAGCDNPKMLSEGAVAKGLSPSIRLATGVGPPDAFAEGLRAPDVRLALGGTLTEDKQKAMVDPATLPALLVSYYYLQPFLENRHRYHFRDWVLDSGAFSAHNSGVEIKLQDYIDCCKRLMAEDPQLTEIYALDVIGDWKASLKNTEEMWRQGVPAIPCFHADEPWDALMGMARDYPKVALGGVALAKTGKKLAWAGQCFSRVWPKKIHGFAFGSEKAIMSLPFHSVDATNWEIGPCKYGQWRAFGGQRVSVRGSQQNLRAEVEWYLDLEKRARERWKKEMQKLEELGPSVRLALAPEGRAGDTTAKALSVRLAMGGEGDSGGSQRAGKVAEAFAPTVRLAQRSTTRKVEEK